MNSSLTSEWNCYCPQNISGSSPSKLSTRWQIQAWDSSILFCVLTGSHLYFSKLDFLDSPGVDNLILLG